MLPPKRPDTIRKKISVKGGPADPEPINHITSKRIVFRIVQGDITEFGKNSTFVKIQIV